MRCSGRCSVLTRLDLQFFKCFELLKLPLGTLTLLSGGNASGKSSVLQALVLLHQTMREHEWSMRLMLNGASIRMGTVTDVVDKASVTGRSAICYYYAIEGALLGPYALKANFDRQFLTLLLTFHPAHTVRSDWQTRTLLYFQSQFNLRRRPRKHCCG